MTRKDFELIAAALKGATPLARDGEKAMCQWQFIVFKMADALATTNPAFQRARFLAACGVSNG